MALPKPTLKLLHCDGDSARISKVLKVIGEDPKFAIEGEMVILFVKKQRGGPAPRKAARKKTAAR